MTTTIRSAFLPQGETVLKAVLQLLPGRFMDVRMRVSDGYETRVVERPGRWMTAADLEQLSSDLRLVAAVLHTIHHIERMGDLCVNIAKMVALMGEPPQGSEEIIAKVEGAARRQPLVFLGGALLLGAIAARFLKAAGNAESPTSTRMAGTQDDSYASTRSPGGYTEGL